MYFDDFVAMSKRNIQAQNVQKECTGRFHATYRYIAPRYIATCGAKHSQRCRRIFEQAKAACLYSIPVATIYDAQHREILVSRNSGTRKKNDRGGGGRILRLPSCPL